MRRLPPAVITALVLVAGFALCTTQFPNFASTRVVANLFTDNAFLGIVATGMTFVIISGGIDLSVGSVIGFTTVFVAVMVERLGVPPLVAFAAILLLCAAFGATMGAIIHVFDMPPFIVTLAGMFLARGSSFLISTESTPITAPIYATVSDFALKLPGGGRLTAIALIMLAVVAAGAVLLHFTRFGANVYALGGSRVTTALMGIPVGSMTVRIYMLSSVLAGLAGIVFSFYTAAGYSLSAVGVELDSIAAVVIGGTLLTGGQGSVIGTLLGVLIQGLIQTYINFDGTLSSWWTKIVTGMLLFAFIGLQQAMLGLARRSRTDNGEVLKSGVLETMTSPLVVIRTGRAHSNHAEVARSLGIDIIAGRYAEGARLPGDVELTAMFGVSRPVLRESVKTLVAKGLLTTKVRVGTVVRERGAWNMFDADVLAWHLDAGIDRRFLNDLAEIRLAVEPRTAALAAERRSEADIAELRRSMERMQREPSDSVGFADADLALHLAVANASGNLFMRSIGNVIEAALRASFLLSAPVETRDRETVLSWHQRIVDAIVGRDAEAAADAMIEVIRNGLRRHEGSVPGALTAVKPGAGS